MKPRSLIVTNRDIERHGTAAKKVDDDPGEMRERHQLGRLMDGTRDQEGEDRQGLGERGLMGLSKVWICVGVCVKNHVSSCCL